ncbi:DUF3299 domain-containing protein [Marinimicrobium sp. ABcell2]|uniref:DUF3299 domain-containing protein n=1 Tax=Marinimicrobium sp. ABcell2 TaxID=3069751 RepID=UPI0027B15E84|nr:DUF3299 domain-containing protein [Marinimicrobium sp. ABcell2]MDQ2076210.1 DUF3299 domain-containing protein [Marinimicrobium sp. ABcell2]
MPHKKLFFIALLISANIIFSVRADDYKTIEWTDLLPDEDLELLLNMPAIDHGDLSDEELAEDQQADGLRTADDFLANQVENAIAQAMGSGGSGGRTWEDALVSTNIRPEFDGAKVRLPGFVVPLEFDDDMNISEFFLVPFFGACIHVPPPPPNQIIFVSYPQGLQLDALYTPFWVTGEMKVEMVENDMALSAYSMEAATIIEYRED